MLVSGVWRLWLTPRRKSSFAASSSSRRAFWAPDPLEQLGVPDSDPDLAREQLQQVLVGAFPATGGRQVPDEKSEAVLAGPDGRPDGQGFARDPVLEWARSPDRPAGSGYRSSRRPVRASSAARPMSQSTPSRGEAATSAARIRPSSRLRRSSSAASRLWLSASRASSSSPVTTIGVLRSPVETRSTAAAIARNGAVRSDASANATRTASSAAMAIVSRRIRGTVEAGSGDRRWAATTTRSERSQREDGRRDEGDREPRPERDPAVDPLGSTRTVGAGSASGS